jgi:hypothetical protein
LLWELIAQQLQAVELREDLVEHCFERSPIVNPLAIVLVARSPRHEVLVEGLHADLQPWVHLEDLVQVRAPGARVRKQKEFLAGFQQGLL